ncbi:hypothetical protein E8E13_001644 [Curvularia kusanoi]|uniref:Fungal N-terminal domain-containing protein n=1 Tax=Curvularia kusanoi TaxID=90978 RepID=A0A9P4W5E6_CURKU|nr:hypothetical protein E8E13_001644 [Curvularia kusanoi]
MEAAGLAFGVIPVAVGILNSYKVVRHTLHSCRHFADEIEEIDARLKSARAYFNNEVQLLRRLAKGTPQVKSFGGDVDSALKASYESCLTTLNRTGKLLDEIQKELLAFESQVSR